MSAPTEKDPLQIVSYSLPEEQVRFISQAAFAQRRSRSNYVSGLIKEAQELARKQGGKKGKK